MAHPPEQVDPSALGTFLPRKRPGPTHRTEKITENSSLTVTDGSAPMPCRPVHWAWKRHRPLGWYLQRQTSCETEPEGGYYTFGRNKFFNRAFSPEEKTPPVGAGVKLFPLGIPLNKVPFWGRTFKGAGLSPGPIGPFGNKQTGFRNPWVVPWQTHLLAGNHISPKETRKAPLESEILTRCT